MKIRERFYIRKGSRIILKDRAYCYRYALYSSERPGVYLYTYAYEEEENWYTHRPEYSLAGWLAEDTIFGEGNLPFDGEYCIAIEVKAAGEGDTGAETEGAVSDNDAACGWRDILEVQGGRLERDVLAEKEAAFLARADVREEIEKTVRAVQAKRTADSLVFTLLSDTHYVENGNWETCAATIEAVNDRIGPDGTIHLGDLTDGILGKEVCKAYSHRVLDRIAGWGRPFYMTIGNHDANYFRKNRDILSEAEQYGYYLKGIVSGNLAEGQLWYDADFPKQRLRAFFLHSYDNAEKIRYGFPQEELTWIREKLAQLPDDYQAVFFSHEAPLAVLDYWSETIRNGEELTRLLDDWNETHGGRILAFVHGHTHADLIYRKRSFPIVSVGCSKIEYFEDKKPGGALAPVRLEGEVSQELWDTIIIDTKGRKIDFVRFGAGMNRETACGRRTKIWAHRGASGYAPENTLEAFALAKELGADGVELDVQFTKDRQIVVIHDETINRVSDGRGYVADYTLEELKKFHFNRTHPEYEEAQIPTLREVLELLKPTELTVNIELKTGVNFYPGIERETVKLVRELGMEERVIYSSFNHMSVKRVKEIDRSAKTGFLFSDGTLAMPQYAAQHGADALHPAWHHMKYPGFAEACRENGIALHVWTVNEKKAIEQMIQFGADAVITNYPDRAYEVIYGKEMPMPERPGQKKETPIAAQIPERDAEEMENKKNALLHLAGVGYSKVRKVFVAIDRAVQKAAGRA